MPRGIVTWPDEATENTVREIWDELAATADPLAAEFATVSLCWELGMTPVAGLSLVGGALELECRF